MQRAVRWLPTLVAVTMGMWVILAPVLARAEVGWRVGEGSVGSAGFSMSAGFDAAVGSITASGGEVMNGDAVEPGMILRVDGTNGSGWVAVEFTDPDDAILMRRWVAPTRPFSSPDGWFYTIGIDLVMTPAPAGESDQLLGRLTLTNLDPTGPITVTEVGIGVYTEDYRGGASDLALDARPGGCGELLARLPLPLRSWESATCVFGVAAAVSLRGVGEHGKSAPVSVDVATAASAGDRIGYRATWLSGDELDASGYPPAPPDSSPPPGVDLQAVAAGGIEGDLRLDKPGAYQVVLRSDRGSPGLEFQLMGYRASTRLAGAQYPMSAAVGGLWIASGLAFPLRRRVAGLLLASAGLAIAGALAVGSHSWYWASTYLLVGAAAPVSAAVGLALTIPSSHGPLRSMAAGITTILALLAGILTLMAGVGSRSYVGDGPGFPWSYHGDYMVLWLHIAGVVITVGLGAIAGALWGSRRADRPPVPSSAHRM